VSIPKATPRPLGYSGDERSRSTREMDEAQRRRDAATPPDFSWLYEPLRRLDEVKRTKAVPK
jgi:hypothetical protein